ncbi:integrase [Inhella inkyongensis]|uniref:Integrase n=1 Tax=Inhella inkyongensis TaxID=392593 RepID=A0A840S2J1_9BURK|nr:tyrosine-type recombinase/integrase [Inhella inkyongensis]MBB5202810.1 integrase [Inhella inkyongensis]
MAIKKSGKGWLADIQPGGRGGKRFRKTFKTQGEAKAWEAWLSTQVNQDPKWAPERRDTRKLSDLIELWHAQHGAGLRAGDGTYRRLKQACEAMGNPVADRFSVEMFAAYRKQRIDAGITASNMNREHAYLRAVFNELIRLGQWSKENPLAKLRQFKVPQIELTYLDGEQISALLDALKLSRNPHVLLISKICLATGARWSEAEGLRETQVGDGLIEYARTKSGKTRAVPVDESLEAEIKKHAHQHGTMGRLFGYSISAFREGVERAGLDLPDGQMTHVLRHTFASHFMMNGGNILTLQRILGHANVTMTMRYSHLSPEHLQEAKALNPLARLTLR